MEGMGGLLEQDHASDAEGRGRANHRADVLGILERDEERAAVGPGLVVRPDRQRHDARQQQGGIRPRNVEGLEERSVQAIPEERLVRGGRPTGGGDPGQCAIGRPRQDLSDDPSPGDQRLIVLADAASAK